MDAAVIAVIGTLGGVVITALTGIATALITGHNQRALAETQAERDIRKSELADRRRDFATFLQAYDDVFAGGEGLFARATAGESGLAPDRELYAEIRRFKQAHLILSITTPLPMWSATDRCLGSIWELLDAAVTGDKQLFDIAVNDTRGPRNDVRAAMRAQLGVVDQPTTTPAAS
jgi:hypothetical protein